MDNDYPYCFACGQQAPVGLHLRFDYKNGEAVCRCVVERVFQGYEGVVHGGIVATLLDEAMAKAVLHTGVVAVTGRMEISYRRPVRVETPLLLRGRVVEARSRVFICSAEVLSEDGDLCAEATSTYVRVKT